MSTIDECSGCIFIGFEDFECSTRCSECDQISKRIEIPAFLYQKRGYSCSNGEGGIRTPDDPKAILDFESSAFNRSATSPGGGNQYRRKIRQVTPTQSPTKHIPEDQRCHDRRIRLHNKARRIDREFLPRDLLVRDRT